MMARRVLDYRREHELLDFQRDGIGYTVGVGRFADGQLAEIFLDCHRRGSAAETAARDCAVLASIALQHRVPLQTLRHALVKLGNGRGAGPLGRALDLLEGCQ